MEINLIKKVANEIKDANVIALYSHHNMDGDAIGSMTALKLGINLKYPDKKVYIVGNDGPTLFKEAILPCDVSTDTEIKEHIDLSIVVDTFDILTRVDGHNFEYENINGESIEIPRKRVCIDHHPKVSQSLGDNVYDVIYQRTTPATGILIYKILQYGMNINVKINEDIVNALYYAIYSDTLGLTTVNVKSETYEVLADIVGLNDRVIRKINKMQFQVPAEMEKSLMRIIKHFKIKNNVGTVITSDDCPMALNFIRNICPSAYVMAKFTRAVDENNKTVYYVSMRTDMDGYDISHIAKQFGGGGHPMACGCTVSKKEIKILIKALHDYVNMMKKKTN